jgi:predicted nuclease of predicted toxin-antitoxin system
MKFLVEAQLSVRLARFLQNAGYDMIHTRDLPEHNATPETVINHQFFVLRGSLIIV